MPVGRVRINVSFSLPMIASDRDDDKHDMIIDTFPIGFSCGALPTAVASPSIILVRLDISEVLSS